MSEPALIVIDMQNSFLHPKGENYYPAAGETVEPVRRLLQAARAGKRLIVHTLDRHRRGLIDFEQKRLPEHCLEGGFDAAYFEGFGPLADNPREVEIVKRRYSAFFATEFGFQIGAPIHAFAGHIGVKLERVPFDHERVVRALF